MSQDETKVANHEETDDVEGHGHKRIAANDEAPAEGESDEVEAHVKRANHARKQ